jgi:ABC-2 type transport system ATP-binding protein
VADTDGYDELLRYLDGRAVHRDPAARVVGVATDGSAAHVRAVLDELDPHRRAVSRFEVRGATLDDVFLALTGHVAASRSDKETANV